MITLTLYGEPVPKGRPRLRRKRASILLANSTRRKQKLAYTPEKTRVAEEMWRYAFKESQQEGYPAGVPLYMCVVFSFTKKRGIPKGDIDNYAKLVMDALQGFAYQNDSQICVLFAMKRVTAYDNAGTLVTIKERLAG